MADWMLVLMPLVALPIVLLFRFLGCTPFKAEDAPTELPPDFDISLSQKNLGVAKGQSKTVTVTITSKNGFNAPTLLSTTGVSGVSAAFAPNPVTPPVNGTITSTLTLAASSSAAATGPTPVVVTITGTATVTTTGTSSPIIRSETLNLTVIEAMPLTPDFSLSLNPASVTVARGQTATYTVNIARVGGFAGPVDLTTTPAGGNFNPNPASGNTSALTRAIPGNAPLGTTNFTVTGTSGALIRTTTGTITITN